MPNQLNNLFDQAVVLTRVLNTGLIMSIEKNEKELNSLEKLLKKETNYNYISLFNSYTGAFHGMLWGLEIVYGSYLEVKNLTEQESKFTKWLGINVKQKETAIDFYNKFKVNYENINIFYQMISKNNSNLNSAVIDFTDLGFGPCAALLTNVESVWKKAERLKIFGAFDLRTMWTKQESDLENQPAVQFNYRLSPLVASCVKMVLMRSKNE